MKPILHWKHSFWTELLYQERSWQILCDDIGSPAHPVHKTASLVTTAGQKDVLSHPDSQESPQIHFDRCIDAIAPPLPQTFQLETQGRLNRREVLRRIDRVCRLPVLADVGHKLRRLGLENDVPVESITSLISTDVSMTAQVFLVANSAYYGIGTPVSSLEEAVARIGVAQLRYMILTVDVLKKMESLNGEFEWTLLWQNAYATGFLAECIREELGLDEIPLLVSTGMMHALGIVILAYLFPELYSGILRNSFAGSKSLLELEDEVLQVNNQEVACYFCEMHNFPEVIVESLRHQLHPSGAGRYQVAAALLQTAKTVATMHKLGFSPDTDLRVAPDLESSEAWKVLNNHQPYFKSLPELLHRLEGVIQTLSLDKEVCLPLACPAPSSDRIAIAA